ncbi:MAG: ABC transporter ATP-binding protein [Proteobacteria bacterium]|nr:ABC transporter ATP-binding protein [Pseudomonadota bacterium]
MSGAPMLQIDALTTTFPGERGPVPVVDDLSLTLTRGEVLALVGESGCGKSLTALSILRLVPRPGRIERGRVRFDGRDLLQLPVAQMRAVRGAEIAMIFQEPMTSLNPVLTIGAQVVEAIALHQPLTRRAAWQHAQQLLALTGIPDPVGRMHSYPHQLSGGMKQRVMIAMAIATRPALLIADEPTTALDVTIQAQILELLRELRQQLGTTVLLITHDLGVVNELADRVAVMYAGRVVELGTREEVLGEPRHPYTQGLLRAIPARARRGQRLTEIPGVVPAPQHWPAGCRFATRCPLAQALCHEVRPAATALSTTHEVSCHAVARADWPAARPALQGRLSQGFAVSAGPPGRPDQSAATKGAAPSLPAPGAALRDAPSRDSGASLLRVEALRTWFPIRAGLLQRTVGWVKAVDGVDLICAAGRTVALVGESGCGKTTVGRSILGLERARAGRVYFDGVDLLALSPRQLLPYRRALQIVFQDPMASLDPRMRARDIVAEGMISFRIGANERERTERVAELMRRVQLDPDQMGRYPHEFSGGQRQRLCIARALAVNPRLLICDEATSALDVSIQAQILNLLRQLQEELQLSYLFITHDLGVVRYLADRIAVMYLGQVVEEGSTERIFEAPQHPYTRALLAAIPAVDARKRHARPRVRGDVPSPARPPPGCRFHPRCSEVHGRCSIEEPPVSPWADGSSRCFLAAHPPKDGVAAPGATAATGLPPQSLPPQA